MPESISPREIRARRVRAFGVATALMSALAGGAVWCLIALYGGRDFAAMSLPIAGAIVWALRANGFTGSMSGALVGAACVLLSCAYSLYLQAAAQVAALLGLPMRAALTQIDPRMAIDIAWANLDVAGLAIVALAVVVAIAGVVWATPRR